MHVPGVPTHVSPALVHCDVEEPTAPHMHRLFAASQVAPVVSPLHVVRVPHRHIPNTQVSPDTAHVTDAQRSYEVQK